VTRDGLVVRAAEFHRTDAVELDHAHPGYLTLGCQHLPVRRA
jgi:hypothetical protein